MNDVYSKHSSKKTQVVGISSQKKSLKTSNRNTTSSRRRRPTDQNTLCPRRITEPILQRCPTARKLITTASTTALIAEPDVRRRGDTGRARGVETRGTAGVDLAGPTTDGVDAFGAVGYGRVAASEGVGDAFGGRGADIGEVGGCC